VIYDFNKHVFHAGPDTNISVPRVSIYDSSIVEIGDRTLIGPHVCLTTDSHETDFADRRNVSGSFARPVKIGSDCVSFSEDVPLPTTRRIPGPRLLSGL
jgi:hypothetical protein